MKTRKMSIAELKARATAKLAVTTNSSLWESAGSERPILTSAECKAIAKNTPFGFDELRATFPKPPEEGGDIAVIEKHSDIDGWEVIAWIGPDRTAGEFFDDNQHEVGRMRIRYLNRTEEEEGQ